MSDRDGHGPVEEPDVVSTTREQEKNQEDIREQNRRQEKLPAEEMSLEEIMAREKRRQVENARKMLIEILNMLFRDYNFKGFRYFRRAVENAETLWELEMAKDLMMVASRFHEASK